jgi:alanine racemase
MGSSVSPARAWAEVNQSHFLHNLEVARTSSACKIMAVLKAGAYGHGLEQMANLLEKAEVAFFGVASVIEARRLAAIGIKRAIYLLGPTFPDERAEVVENRWIASLSSLEEAIHFNRLNQAREPLEVHLTVDTGMGRGGFLPDQVIEFLPKLLEMKFLHIVGIGSHLPSADEDREFTLNQFADFDKLIERINNLAKFKFIHLSNSAGLLDYKSQYCNLARPGLMLYGISPMPKFQHLLRPVMTLKSRVSLVRELPAGHGISYGRSCILERDTRVATIGIGYGDGYPRQVSGKGAEVWIKHSPCKLLGRVTMDQLMVDVTHLPDCNAGDEVELFGENIFVSELAEKANLIPWEILTGITPRVLREYI